MANLGRHILLEMHSCSTEKLNDLPYLRQVMIDAIESIGATVIDHVFHQFSPHGVTGVIAIAESHCSIHTWPEYGYAAMDIFTCGESIDPAQAAAVLISKLECKQPQMSIIERGVIHAVPQPVEALLAAKVYHKAHA